MRRHGGRAPCFRQCAIKIGHRLVGVALQHVEHGDGGDKTIIITATHRGVKEEVTGFFKARQRAQIADATLDVGMAGFPVIGLHTVCDEHGIGGKQAG